MSWKFYFSIFLCLGGMQQTLGAASRIKDIASFEGVRDNQLTGTGLVVGLNGTGDRSQTIFSTQALANMLERSELTVNSTQMRVKNIAVVSVTATLPPSAHQGSQVDITVSSIGDASSLQGGVLLQTPLRAADGMVYVAAQGQITLGGFSGGGGGNRVQSNHPTGGRIPNGGIIERNAPQIDYNGKSRLNLILHQNDFTTASRAVHVINASASAEIARAMDGRTIEINVPSSFSGRIIDFIALIENAEMEVDVPARVVINEKTGTIVFGKDVKVAEVSIIHGSLSLQVGTIFNVSQPQGLSKGETTVTPETVLNVQEDKGRTATLHNGASVEEIVKALSAIGAGPRDIIAILQAIKALGALQAELEII
jgi:flagellar P-ring protein FlgI